MDPTPQENTNTPTTEPVGATLTTQPPAEGESYRKDSGLQFTETTILAAISYLSVLVFIPLLTQKGNPFIMFHVKQGLLVFALGVLVWAFDSWLSGITSILQLAMIVFMLLGIVNALRGDQKPLPLIGQLARHIKL